MKKKLLVASQGRRALRMWAWRRPIARRYRRHDALAATEAPAQARVEERRKKGKKKKRRASKQGRSGRGDRLPHTRWMPPSRTVCVLTGSGRSVRIVDGVGRSRRERAPGSGNDGVDARGSVHQTMKREFLNVLCRVFGRFRRLVCMRAYRSECEWALDLASCHERNRTPKVGGERELDPGPW